MNSRLYKRISLIGILAIAAFFLPWIKACNQVETGYSLFFLEIAKRISFDSINMLIAGLVFLLIPLYTVVSAHLVSNTSVPSFIKIVFAALSILAIWNLANMGIPIFESAQNELPKSYYLGMWLFIIFGLCFASLLSFLTNFYIWKRDGFKLILADIILLFSLIPLILWGISFGAKVGLWIYFSAICIRLAAALIYLKKIPDSISR